MEVLGAPKIQSWRLICMLLQGNVSSNHLFGRLQLCTDYLTFESFEYTSDQTSNWNHSEKTLENTFSAPKIYQKSYLAWPRADAADFGFGLVFGAVTHRMCLAKCFDIFKIQNSDRNMGGIFIKSLWRDCCCSELLFNRGDTLEIPRSTGSFSPRCAASFHAKS